MGMAGKPIRGFVYPRKHSRRGDYDSRKYYFIVLRNARFRGAVMCSPLRVSRQSQRGDRRAASVLVSAVWCSCRRRAFLIGEGFDVSVVPTSRDDRRWRRAPIHRDRRRGASWSAIHTPSRAAASSAPATTPIPVPGLFIRCLSCVTLEESVAGAGSRPTCSHPGAALASRAMVPTSKRDLPDAGYYATPSTGREPPAVRCSGSPP